MNYILIGIALVVGVIIGQISVWRHLHKKFRIPWWETISDKLMLKKENYWWMKK